MSKKRKDVIDMKEMMRLTKAAKAWDFTCSFCFKKFSSAQAMGDHQNAHRGERLEERRLFVRDPIGYRKRAFLRAAAKLDQPSAAAGGFVHAAEFNGGGGGGDGDNRFLRQQHEDSSVANNVINGGGIVGDGGKGKTCIEVDIGGCGINLDQELDLTLKL